MELLWCGVLGLPDTPLIPTDLRVRDLCVITILLNDEVRWSFLGGVLEECTNVKVRGYVRHV